MRHARLRRPAAAALAAIAVLGLSACTKTNFSAQTSQQYQAGIGADVRDTPVQILGGLVVENADGSGTLSAALLNTTDEVQELLDLTVVDNEGNEVEVVTEGDRLTLPIGRAVPIGVEDSKIFTLAEVEPGRYYTITATFDGAGEVELHLPAVARSSIYTDIVGDEDGAALEQIEQDKEAAKGSESHSEDSGH